MLLRCGSGVMMWNPNPAPTRGVGGRIKPQCAGSGRSTHASPLRRALSCWKKCRTGRKVALCATWPRIQPAHINQGSAYTRVIAEDGMLMSTSKNANNNQHRSVASRTCSGNVLGACSSPSVSSESCCQNVLSVCFSLDAHCVIKSTASGRGHVLSRFPV